MSDTQFLAILMSLVATLFGIIILILGWLGNKMYEQLMELNRSVPTALAEIGGKVRELDRRVGQIETHIFDRRAPRHDSAT